MQASDNDEVKGKVSTDINNRAQKNLAKDIINDKDQINADNEGGIKPQGSGRQGSVSVQDGGQDVGSSTGSH